VSALKPVRDVMRSAMDAVTGFQHAVAEYRDSPVHGWTPGEGKRPRLNSHATRSRATEAIQAAQTAMLDEFVAL
jgi:hypothetical protein